MFSSCAVRFSSCAKGFAVKIHDLFRCHHEYIILPIHVYPKKPENNRQGEYGKRRHDRIGSECVLRISVE